MILLVYQMKEVHKMTQVEIRTAKAELHKTIIDIIVGYNPNDDEMDELLDYVKNLAEIEKNY